MSQCGAWRKWQDKASGFSWVVGVEGSFTVMYHKYAKMSMFEFSYLNFIKLNPHTLINIFYYVAILKL